MNKIDEILRRDDVWFNVAIAVAFAVFLGVFIGVFIAFLGGASDAVTVAARIDVLYKLGLIGAGFITFSTVVWRGLIATQQVDAQRKQLDKLSAQIVATENSNLASLLQKGAELIADAESAASVAAGIASLRAVGEGSDEQFGVQAMDILADYIQQRHLRVFGDQVGQSAINALRLIHTKTKRVSTRSLDFSFEPEYEEPEDDVRFDVICGVTKIGYSGGRFEGAELTPDAFGTATVVLHSVRILEGHIDFMFPTMSNCSLKDVAIVRFDPRRVYNNELAECDFSDCQVNSPSSFPDMRGTRNWFRPFHQPKSDIVDMDWSTKLWAGRPPELEEESDSLFALP